MQLGLSGIYPFLFTYPFIKMTSVKLIYLLTFLSSSVLLRTSLIEHGYGHAFIQGLRYAHRMSIAQLEKLEEEMAKDPSQQVDLAELSRTEEPEPLLLEGKALDDFEKVESFARDSASSDSLSLVGSLKEELQSMAVEVQTRTARSSRFSIIEEGGLWRDSKRLSKLLLPASQVDYTQPWEASTSTNAASKPEQTTSRLPLNPHLPRRGYTTTLGNLFNDSCIPNKNFAPPTFVSFASAIQQFADWYFAADPEARTSEMEKVFSSKVSLAQNRTRLGDTLKPEEMSVHRRSRSSSALDDKKADPGNQPTSERIRARRETAIWSAVESGGASRQGGTWRNSTRDLPLLAAPNMPNFLQNPTAAPRALSPISDNNFLKAASPSPAKRPTLDTQTGPEPNIKPLGAGAPVIRVIAKDGRSYIINIEGVNSAIEVLQRTVDCIIGLPSENPGIYHFYVVEGEGPNPTVYRDIRRQELWEICKDVTRWERSRLMFKMAYAGTTALQVATAISVAAMMDLETKKVTLNSEKPLEARKRPPPLSLVSSNKNMSRDKQAKSSNLEHSLSKEKPKDISTNSHVKTYKPFRVGLDDPCHKVLPAALEKYNINEDWRQYALYIVYGDQERCLGLNEKPLWLFKQIDSEGRKPMFMLRKHTTPLEGYTATIQSTGLRLKESSESIPIPAETL